MSGLNMLFESSARSGRPITQAQLADAVIARGHSLSWAHISQLRGGIRTNPSAELVSLLADFFNVDEEFFFPPANEPGVPDSTLLAGLTNASLRRLLLRVVELSDASTGLVVEMAEHLRDKEKLLMRPERIFRQR
ncbi:helix-turn-helix domain-containing protein [Rhodococcus sp. EPR-134]|uniref:helix-turn-helix domain-containing protein n=1 Tax=Rhodococcus sp. EPR-134 TaxID=1813675 RepID=UPI0007D04876|nr:helix-turn-helix domain-containing protein [Rhodococcus sp. EPR-134]